MSDTAQITRLAELKNPSTKLLGQTASQLYQLSQQNFPIPSIYLLDAYQVEQILKYNQVDIKIKQLLDLTRPTNSESLQDAAIQISGWIKSCQIPAGLAEQLLHFYHQHFTKQKVAIMLSSNTGQTDQEKIRVTTGDANFIANILKTIGKGFSSQLLQQLIEQKRASVAPGAVLFFTYGSPTTSGLAFSRHPETGDKHKILINAGPLMAHLDHQFDQHHEFDIYQNSITSSYAHNSVANKMEEKIIQQLVQIVQNIKKKQLDHLIIEWILDGDQPKIIKLHPEHQACQTYNHHLPVQTLVAGNVYGQLVPHRLVQNTKVSNPLICLDYLSHQNLDLIKNATGLILKKPPSQLILNILKNKKIPTVLTTQIPDYLYQQHLQLNADHSWLATYQQHLPINKQNNSLKLITQTNQTSSHYQEYLTQTDGIMINSDLIWQKLKIHPQQLIDKGQAKLYQQAALQLVENYVQLQMPFLFQSLTLSQEQLTKYKGGKNYKLDHHDQIKGSQHFIYYPQILELEINTIAAIQQQTLLPINWVGNNINSATDWQLIKYHVDKLNKNLPIPISAFLEIDNPAMLLKLDENISYQGLIINLTQISAHLLGLENNEDLLRVDHSASIRLIKSIILNIAKVPVYIILDRYQQDLIEQLQQLSSGLIIPPRFIPIIKNNHFKN